MVKRLRDFDFTAAQYAENPDGVIAEAVAYARAESAEEKTELEKYLRIVYEGKKTDAVLWEPLSRPLQEGGRITGRIGEQVVSGTVTVAPKTICVELDLPARQPSAQMSLPLIYPAIFTQDPWEGSPANDYGVDAARRLLLNSYYGSLEKKR